MRERVIFHGSYGSKAKARRKLRAGKGRYVKLATVKGKRRYLILSRREQDP